MLTTVIVLFLFASLIGISSVCVSSTMSPADVTDLSFRLYFWFCSCHWQCRCRRECVCFQIQLYYTTAGSSGLGSHDGGILEIKLSSVCNLLDGNISVINRVHIVVGVDVITCFTSAWAIRMAFDVCNCLQIDYVQTTMFST